jgi:hypothetical protein
MTKWSWMMVCVVLSGFLMFLRLGIHQTIVYEFHDVGVQKTAPFEYWLIPRKAPRFHTTVCRDYQEPAFKTGMRLQKAIFIDMGNCWSLDPNKHAGYYIERGEDGKPIRETEN